MIPRAACVLGLGLMFGLSGCSSGPNRNPDDVVADKEIEKNICWALLQDPTLRLRPVKVESTRGIVTLSGKVRSADESQRIEAIARSTSGVVRVLNRLQIDPGLP